MRALRGWTSGLAIPYFVIDAPGGGGKIPILPEYVESMNEEEVVLKNFRGERYVYRQPREETGVIELTGRRGRTGRTGKTGKTGKTGRMGKTGTFGR
jgi:hypothetical protein